MAFLESRCIRTVLTPAVLNCCEAFSCGNEDLDAFFSSEQQECVYRNIDSAEKLHTRMMYFDLMLLSSEKEGIAL
jgi:hypothetical protein